MLITRNLLTGEEKGRLSLFELLHDVDISYALVVRDQSEEDGDYMRLWIIHQSDEKRLQLLGIGDNLYYTLQKEANQWSRQKGTTSDNNNIFYDDDKVTPNNIYYSWETLEKLIELLDLEDWVTGEVS